MDETKKLKRKQRRQCQKANKRAGRAAQQAEEPEHKAARVAELKRELLAAEMDAARADATIARLAVAEKKEQLRAAVKGRPAPKTPEKGPAAPEHPAAGDAPPAGPVVSPARAATPARAVFPPHPPTGRCVPVCPGGPSPCIPLERAGSWLGI
ncbi:uncharacterized protein N7446_006992 [Penicillium canescens]|uniref:Uncharacterized protein n=1 Tax=Penicillium canescens TaxID=5083 RepID=A0AAD6NCP2_PENCN|nr:uncharacterized protein N7446_006992 [Penicillium canescens]KAJ6052350.1 hypothetical protein N7460_002884 [Penicillium canescens]KAJ6062872.1 hypothetical protein N7446_006992 [Penicillium canescens]